MKITSDLVEKAKSGNSIAWNELYSATFPVAYGVAMQLVKNKDVADDIVQDSYITAFTKLDTLEDNEKFQHWFNRIVANNCKNYLVKKKPDLFSQHSTFTEDGEEMEFDVVDDRTEYQPDNAVISSEIKQLFYDMVAKLPEEQRTCALMFWVQELTIPEIAEILGVSQNTVKSRIHYAKKKLTAEADDMKKKGISVFSITGFALIPFLRWLFKNGSGITASPQKAEGVLQIAKSAGSVAKSANTVTNTVKTVTDTTKVVNNVGKAAKTATTVATKTATKSIATKIGIGAVATAIVATGAVTGIVGGGVLVANSVADVKVSDFVYTEIVCDGYNGYGSLNDINEIIDIEGLEAKLWGKNIEQYYDYCEEYDVSIEDYITVDANREKDGTLTNGDKVQVDIYVDYDKINEFDNMKKELDDKSVYSFTCTITGLKDVVEIDLFSTLKTVGIETFDTFLGNDFPLVITFDDEDHRIDYGPCLIRWDEQEYNRIVYYVEFTDEEGQLRTEDIIMNIHAPRATQYVTGNTIPASLRLDGDEFLNYGFKFKELEKDLTVDYEYNYIKSDNIAKKDYDFLKKTATKKATMDFPNGVQYIESFVVASDLCYVYRSNLTGTVFAYCYRGFITDQYGNGRYAEDISPVIFQEFLGGTEFDSVEELEKEMINWHNAPIIRVNK